ncbi:MAG: ATP-dependent DNA helicase, partial [Gammaproteobacteria bacterium]|nr:ATP-dependent DNA helicase [Gammaproteobacteria bacterium]NIV19926.1 ATP-dependent DNA helicase [Gammaproteobacteria bacterium]
QKIFYLTSRSTGSLAALDACERLDPSGDYLRRVHIVARERACPVEGVPCDPAVCQYANGYYDRIHGALAKLLEQPVMDAPRVAEVAEAH